MTAALLVNPYSRRNNQKGMELARKLDQAAGVHVRVLEDFTQLPDVLDTFATASVTSLFISSGDGTIQEIQTLINERQMFRQPPSLCLLPHGTTNLTASDLGFRIKNLDAQAEFIRNPAPRDTVRRATLRVANPLDGKARHGMFLGTGAVTQAVIFCQQAVHRSGLKGDFATFATLAMALLQASFSKPDPNDAARIDRPHPITVTVDGISQSTGNQLLLILTTLDRLILGTRPFWGEKSGPLRGTVFPYPIPSIPRWIIPSMYGSDNRTPPPGARSFSGRTCLVETTSSFVIDGEFFDPPAHEPLRVEAGPEITYIRA